VGFLATRLALVDIFVLPLEAATLLLLRNDFFKDGLLAILLVEAATVELGCSFDNGAYLRKGWDIILRVVLFVVTLRVKNIPHLEQLQVATQLWSELSLWHVEPFGTRSGFLLLFNLVSYLLEVVMK
jgi:hypothetical protein